MRYQYLINLKSTWRVLVCSLSFAMIFSSCKKDDDPELTIQSSDLHGTWVYVVEYSGSDSTYSRNDTVVINSDLSFGYTLSEESSGSGSSGSFSEGAEADTDGITWTYDEATQRFEASLPASWPGDQELWNVKVICATSTAIVLDQDVSVGFWDWRVGEIVTYTKIQ